MSNVTETPVPQPGPLSHTERARAVLDHIRGIRELISEFIFAGEPDPRTLNAPKSVSDRFLEITAVAIEASPELAASARVTPAELRDVTAFVQAFLPVADELTIMLRGVNQTIAVKRAGVGQLALQVYQFAKTLARKTQRRVLIPHLDAMREALGRTRTRQTSEQPDQTPRAAGEGGSNA